jgi:hypothetical protein
MRRADPAALVEDHKTLYPHQSVGDLQLGPLATNEDQGLVNDAILWVQSTVF